MKKALMYASVASMIQQFNMENIRLLQEQGYEVDVACNMVQGSSISNEKITAMKQELEQIGVRVFHIPVPRKVTAVSDIFRSISLSRELMEKNGYDLIHCHSPIGGMVCRLANRLSKTYYQTRMLYTAHGFHFYKGAPKLNWLLYYPVEWLCARYTDKLITINKEDYILAQRLPLKKGGSALYVPGIGIDLEKIEQYPQMREQLCKSCGIDENAVLMLSVGELNDNKNHKVVLEKLPEFPPNVHYLICGQGQNEQKLQDMAETFSCGNRLHILGFRNDVVSIMKSCDFFVFPSKREGLSVALMEAMACGMPCCAGNIRGNSDLLEQAGGILLNMDSFGEELVKHIQKIPDLTQYKQLCKERNLKVINGFSKTVVQEKMRSIYAE